MIDKLKETFKHSFIFGLGGVITKLIGLILIPLYTREIPVDEYGVLGLLEFFGQVFAIFFGLGLISALFRWFNTISNSKEKAQILFTVLVMLVGLFSVTSAIGISFRHSIALLLTGNPLNERLIIYVLINYSAEAIKNILLTIYRIEKKSIKYIAILSISLLINLGLNIYLVAYLKLSIEGILIGNTVAALLTLMLLIVDLRKQISPHLMIDELWKMIRFGFPLVFATLAGILLMMSDRYLLKMFSTMENVGLYTLAYKIAGVINLLLIQSFRLAWPAIAWDAIKKDNPERFISKVLTYFSFLVLWIILAFSLFTPELVKLFIKNESYWESIKVVPIIAFSFAFYGMYYLVGIIFHFQKQTRYLPIILMICAGLNIFLNIILIPQFNIYGAAYSTLISYFVMFLLTLNFAQKVMPVPYEIKKLILIASLITLSYLAGTSFLTESSVVIRLLYKSGLIIVFPISLFLFNFYEEIEKQRIGEILRKWGNWRNLTQNLKNQK